MKKHIKKIFAVLIAATTLAVNMAAIPVSAAVVYDGVPGESKDWNVRTIGGGAPGTEDIINRFWVFNSSAGQTGNCKTITSADTTFAVTVTCIDGEHKLSQSLVWNGKGNKTWKVSGPNTNIYYDVTASGRSTYSTGTISRI